MSTAITIRAIRKLLELAKELLETCISSTASSYARNRMCDANIFLGQAIIALKDLEL